MTLKYCSTRGGVSGLSFKEAVMMGLADDGGLLVPDHLPDLTPFLEQWRGASYVELAHGVMTPFISDIDSDVLATILEGCYASFDEPLVTPVRQVGDYAVLELFHGPTLAFKDIALQFLGSVFELILSEQHRAINIVGATSGDTGSAAIAGVRGKANIDIFVMFPEGKTSPVQELQMTTVMDDNVHNLGIRGSFDDCQSMLKETFADLPFKSEYSLAAVNSVNWARVLAQVVYYFSAWYQLGEPEEFDVSVPTGNFGNIFAGYLAKQMGLPIRHLILATNDNDILSRFFNTGHYSRGEVRFTHSPAMDIQVSSNLERYLYFYMGQSADKVRTFMDAFLNQGEASIQFNTRLLDNQFRAGSATNQQTIDTIGRMYADHDYLVDPHTAVGICVADQFKSEIPMLVLSTAHPAKFDGAIRAALPDVAAAHPLLADLDKKPTRKSVLDADVDALKAFIRSAH
jgi:threonine synthase